MHLLIILVQKPGPDTLQVTSDDTVGNPRVWRYRLREQEHIQGVDDCEVLAPKLEPEELHLI